jgi:hypothetical protein
LSSALLWPARCPALLVAALEAINLPKAQAL